MIDLEKQIKENLTTASETLSKSIEEKMGMSMEWIQLLLQEAE